MSLIDLTGRLHDLRVDFVVVWTFLRQFTHWRFNISCLDLIPTCNSVILADRWRSKARVFSNFFFSAIYIARLLLR